MFPWKHFRPPRKARLRVPINTPCSPTHIRLLSAGGPKQPGTKAPRKRLPDKINYNADTFTDMNDVDHANFKRVTSNDLASYTEPPTEVKMLVRDFIEDSLYNPHYGYFPKQVNIFTATETIDFASLRNTVQFQDEVARRYAGYGLDETGPGRQIWHTPTELFKPWYGRAIAQCLVSEYLLKYFPYEDFSIYEIGGGNGTLARDILDYIQEEYPDVYDRTRYNIIEISENLANLQREKLCSKHPCVTVTNQSIFHWEKVEPAPSYFLAMEVIDNFAHDMIRYDLRTLEPYQGVVVVDGNGDYSTLYARVTDPLISSFLSLRRRLSHSPSIPRLLRSSSTLRNIYTSLPFAPNLSPPEFIPTRLLSLLRTLRKYFPRHRLLLSDFSSLPDTIPGVNAPVVQTRYQNTTVPCTTLFVKPGYFDIFFPTNFEHLRDMYEDILSQPVSLADTSPRASPLAGGASPLSVGAGFFSSYHPKNRRTPTDGIASSSGLPVGERKSNVFTHAEFMEAYADLAKTRLRNGENPMVDYYKNVKFLF
ncbi:S-adenosyl-L-methionine-dependent methyltransferase [Cristinia sonorae]|uniref:Protein arginine methyltransferase NDUFAF7 n=1 Tax=Cristinia sonorae TaxID=1940300 RepID=A0A8K0UDK8_9AGAR|nr:S-adenosyl-L-methionine-dependent methyltransferase [Cristinia sonorae]